MSTINIIALILLIIGIGLIIGGIIGIRRNNISKTRTHYPLPESQPKMSDEKSDVLQKMQNDDELKKRILEEIEKKSQ